MAFLEGVVGALGYSPTIERTIKRAIGEKDSKRIIHFNEIRERFLALEISAKRQAHLMRLELSSAIKTPEKTLHLINLILMLFSHCQPGFSGALTEPESIEELLACFVLCKTRSNVAIKLAWLIKLLASEGLSEAAIRDEEINAIGFDTFRRASWVPEMTLDDYNELEGLIISKYKDLNTVSDIMRSIDKSDDIKMIEKQRGNVKELEYRLMQDERFLQEVRSSFCVSNWPETRIAEMLKFIGKALTTIDNLLTALRNTSDLGAASATGSYGAGASCNVGRISSDNSQLLKGVGGRAAFPPNHCSPRMIKMEFRAYEAKKKEVVDKYARAHDIGSIISIINATDDVEVLKKQHAAAKDLQQRLIKDAEDLRDLERQCCPTVSSEEPLKHFLLQANNMLATIKGLLETLEESSQQGKPPSPPPPPLRQQRVESNSPECDSSECIMNTEPIDMDTYQCPMCRRVLHSQGLLNTHMNLEHK